MALWLDQLCKSVCFSNLLDHSVDNRYPKNIIDKHGLKYQLTIDIADAVVCCHLWYQSNQVGSARCLKFGHELLIGDLLIHEPNRGGFLSVIRQMITRQPKTYRGRGLGSALLKHVIEVAKDLDVHVIHGSVTKVDMASTPYLLDWYKNQGFQIEKPTQNEVKGAVARISLGLNPKE